MTTSALQALEAPVLLRLQHLPHQRHVVVADDAHEQDRQIAGDAVRPQAGLPELVRRDGRGAGAQRAVGAEHARRQPLEQHARRRPRCRDGAVPLCACVKASANVRAAALGSRYFRASASAVSRSDAMPVAKREPHRCAPADSRMRWRRLTIGSSTMPVVPDSARPSSATGSVGRRGRGRGSARDRFPIRPAPAAGPRGSGRGTPTPPASAAIARPAMAEQRGAVGQVFGFDEQLAERRVRQVGGRRRQHDLGVAGDVDLADARARGCARSAGAPRRRLRSRRRCRAASRSRRRGGGRSRVRREKVDEVVVRLAPRRLIGGRPDLAAAHVAQVDELAAGIARRVAAPAWSPGSPRQSWRRRRRWSRRDVVAVRQELRVRERRVRRAVAAHRDRRRSARRRASRRAAAARSVAESRARAPAAAARSPGRAGRRESARPSDRRAARWPARPASCPAWCAM